MSRRSTIAVGPALLSTALSSTALAGTLNPLNHTLMNGVFCYFKGHPSFAAQFDTTLSQSGLSQNYFMGSNFVNVNTGSVAARAYGSGSEDLMRAVYRTGNASGFLPPPSLTQGIISWTVTFATAVEVTSMSGELPGNWMWGSTPIALGQVFTAGQHTFGWSLDPSGAWPNFGTDYAMQLGVSAAASTGVPLPGAAGLAARQREGPLQLPVDHQHAVVGHVEAVEHAAHRDAVDGHLQTCLVGDRAPPRGDAVHVLGVEVLPHGAHRPLLKIAALIAWDLRVPHVAAQVGNRCIHAIFDVGLHGNRPRAQMQGCAHGLVGHGAHVACGPARLPRVEVATHQPAEGATKVRLEGGDRLPLADEVRRQRAGVAMPRELLNGGRYRASIAAAASRGALQLASW